MMKRSIFFFPIFFLSFVFWNFSARLFLDIVLFCSDSLGSRMW
jgi:hypothetical protein